MEYHVENSFDYLLFRDAFEDYVERESDVFGSILTAKMDYEKNLASLFIGKAHYSQFLSYVLGLEPTPLAKQEISAARTVVYELNVVIIREDIATGRCFYDSETRRDVERHKSLFPAVYHEEKECCISLPEDLEPLLDTILSFQDLILRFDVDGLVAFLGARYQGADHLLLRERLSLLSHYYKAGIHIAKCRENILRHRRERQ